MVLGLGAMQAVFAQSYTDLVDTVKEHPALSVLCASVTGYLGFRWIQDRTRRCAMLAAIADLDRHRTEDFRKLRSTLEAADAETKAKWDEILALSLKELIEKLQWDELSSVQVLEAYQWAALQAQDQTNCICQMVKEARQWAAALDEKYENSPDKPPLFGVPVSIKESFAMNGYIPTRGYAQSLLPPLRNQDQEAVLVSALKDLGAVPFCRTNVPQTLFSFTCSNPVYGATNHPASKQRSSGGSSGGEAALIACGGSLLGLGGDVGGSIRMPAHFCGVVGFKPTSARMSPKGSHSSIPGRAKIYASAGPMTRDVHACALATQLLMSPVMFDKDPLVTPLPFDMTEFNSERKLKIGWYDYNGLFEAVPACRRAVALAKQVLENQGHTLVKIQRHFTPEIITLYWGANFIDGGYYLHQLLKRDIIDQYHTTGPRIYRTPICIRHALSYLINPVFPRLADMLGASTGSTRTLREMYATMDQARYRFADYWQRQGFDAVICPPNGATALKHNGPGKAMYAATYVAVFNLLDCPAGVVPCTKVVPEDIKELQASYKITDPMDRIIVEQCGTEDSVGLPVGIQVVTLPYRDELCLRVMQSIENGLKEGNN